MSIITKTCALLFLFSSLSFNAGAQWSSVDSGTTNALRGVYLLDSGVGYAVGDAGTILKTTDAGVTWSALNSGTTKSLYDVFFFNDAEGVAVGDSGLILRTIDGGATWPTLTSGVRDGLRSVSFNGANGICGGLSQDILYSTDSGATWHVSQKGFFGGGFFGAHMLSPTLGFVAGQNSIFQPTVGATVDGGVHWSFQPFYFNGNEGNCDDLFFFDSLNGVTTGVIFDGTGAIARTVNGGVDWNSTLFSQGMQGIDFPKPETGFAVGFVGTILRSTDLGNTWSPQTSGTSADLFDVHLASDGLTGVAVGASGTILRTANGGQAGGLELLAAASRKGNFDIDLPLNGTPGIECRAGGANGNFQITLTFNNAVASVDDVAASCGIVHGVRRRASDPHSLRVSLTGTCNAQYLTLTLTNVHDDQGNILPSAKVTAGLLLGDVNGDGVVDATDADQTALDQGETTDADNFREDINSNGSIDAADLARVESQVGAMLPPLAMPSIFVIDESDNSVITANLDGTDATDLGNIGGFLNNPVAIAVNASAGKLYVANESGNSVTMSNLDGSSPVNLTLGGLLQIPVGLALDLAGGKIYIAVQSGPNVVVRANLDGSGAEGLGDFGGLVTGLFAQGMDIDTAHGKIYVAVNSGPEGQVGRIVEADLTDGANAVVLDFGGMLNGATPFDVKVDAAQNRMYLLDFGGLLYRADLSGNGAVNLGNPAGPFACCLALDLVGAKMYISALDKVTQADLPDGNNPVTLNITSLGVPKGVAIYRP